MVAIAQLVEHLIVVQKVALATPIETSEDIPRFFVIPEDIRPMATS